MRCTSLPNNLISKVLLTEYLVHKNLYIMSYVIVEMYIYACGIAHYRLDSHEVLVHPVEVVLLIPNVAIHLLLEFLHVAIVELLLCLVDSLLHERISAYINLLCVVGTRSERRVDIYKVYLYALVFEVGTSRQTLAVHDDIAVGVCSDGLAFSHFV